jgi:hypothetical protein
VFTVELRQHRTFFAAASGRLQAEVADHHHVQIRVPVGQSAVACEGEVARREDRREVAVERHGRCLWQRAHGVGDLRELRVVADRHGKPTERGCTTSGAPTGETPPMDRSADWAALKDALQPMVGAADTAEFGTQRRRALATLGWGDGVHISRDGLHLYALHSPTDLRISG